MKYLRKEDVVARSAAGEHLLVPIHCCSRSLYTLNDSGLLLWDLIDKPRTEDDLAGALAAKFDLPRVTALRDVRVFLADMVRLGLARALDS